MRAFFVAPLPVALHIVGATVFLLIGAFQFAPGFRRRRPRWHRLAGRVLIPAGLLAAFTGLWMTLSYPPREYDGPLLENLRLISGAAMILFLCLGLDAVRWRNFPAHRGWMLRAYALGLGAGTQVFTRHLVSAVAPQAAAVEQ